jgi:hypothetical protein
MVSDAIRLDGIAMHEAGHAVVAVDTGIGIEWVEMDDSSGLCKLRPPQEDSEDQLEKRIIVFWAGQVAQYKTKLLSCVLKCWEHDNRCAFGMLQTLEARKRARLLSAEPLLERLRQETVDETEKRVLHLLSTIRRVAFALRKSRKLTEGQVVEIIRDHSQPEIESPQIQFWTMQ